MKTQNLSLSELSEKKGYFTSRKGGYTEGKMKSGGLRDKIEEIIERIKDIVTGAPAPSPVPVRVRRRNY